MPFFVFTVSKWCLIKQGCGLLEHKQYVKNTKACENTKNKHNTAGNDTSLDYSETWFFTLRYNFSLVPLNNIIANRFSLLSSSVWLQPFHIFFLLPIRDDNTLNIINIPNFISSKTSFVKNKVPLFQSSFFACACVSHHPHIEHQSHLL